MRYISTAAFAFALLVTAAPAFAQLSGGGLGTGAGSPGGVQPRVRTPDIAPPALPGAGTAPLATGPVIKKTVTGDPTTELFSAVNSGDYNAAQDAISRGADLTAQNNLGETPLDLSVALNRSSITFLILSARNEEANAGPITPGPAFHQTKDAIIIHPKPTHITPQKPAPTATNNPGTPNPNAGFLGFSPKK
ncbi:MAG TPA: ankyrin repeat domain-containing protein [Acidocella sp.]|nr:MAG: hypothetical protein B7Z81_01485 [Acidocella sp. 20-61-6]HQT46857.1 ankyrin repeat domain-containing protein [Acidocella sp.]